MEKMLNNLMLYISEKGIKNFSGFISKCRKLLIKENPIEPLEPSKGLYKVAQDF